MVDFLQKALGWFSWAAGPWWADLTCRPILSTYREPRAAAPLLALSLHPAGGKNIFLPIFSIGEKNLFDKNYLIKKHFYSHALKQNRI